MNIIAIDPSTVSTGLSIKSPQTITSFTIKRVKNENIQDYCKRIFSHIHTISTYTNFFFIEVPQGNNTQTLAIINRMIGMLDMLVYNKYHVAFNLIKPSEWRKLAGIKGRRRAEFKAHAMLICDNSNIPYDSDDEAEAICFALAMEKQLTNAI